MKHINQARRHFLQTASGMAAAAAHPMGTRFSTPFAMSLAGLGAMAAQSSRAADTSGPYKALVCLFLAGGNDSANWLVPTDAAGYSEYAATRRDLAWPAGRLLPVTSSGQGAGRSFGMPQELAPLRDLYEAGRMAWVANVGPLERPITKAEYLAGRDVPAKLFSHNDQASNWQSLSPEGATSGWGGRMGDLLMSANQYPVFTAVSAAGNAVFLSGSQVVQYQVNSAGPVRVNALDASQVHGSVAAVTALRQVLAQTGNNDYQREYARVAQRSLDTTATLQAGIASTSVAALPNTPIALPNGGTLNLSREALAQQLRVVAQMVAAAPRLGMRRQVFMVSLGGFDTHANQMRDQPLLMARVAHAVSWFMSALAGQGLQNNVTLFSASDFGRTLTSNGQGSDHGWGANHFVVGGAVRGKQIFGRVPNLALRTDEDIGSGRMLPAIGVTPYAATLGKWMGLTDVEVAAVLPNTSLFSSGNLGFL